MASLKGPGMSKSTIASDGHGGGGGDVARPSAVDCPCIRIDSHSLMHHPAFWWFRPLHSSCRRGPDGSRPSYLPAWTSRYAASHFPTEDGVPSARAGVGEGGLTWRGEDPDPWFAAGRFAAREVPGGRAHPLASRCLAARQPVWWSDSRTKQRRASSPSKNQGTFLPGGLLALSRRHEP